METLSHKVLVSLSEIFIGETTSYSGVVARTLRALRDYCMSVTGRPDMWGAGDRVFIYEWPELGGGAGEGVSSEVYERVGATSVFVGRYKIDGEGRVIEFPFLPDDVVLDINQER